MSEKCLSGVSFLGDDIVDILLVLGCNIGPAIGPAGRIPCGTIGKRDSRASLVILIPSRVN